MNPSSQSASDDSRSRRDFIKKSSILVAGGAVGSGLSVARSAHAQGSDTIKIGLVGCGGRGTGAAIQAMNTKGDTKLVAMADAFGDAIQRSLRGIKGKHPEKVDVPPERQFTGFDGYQKVLNENIDLVILTTPPGFRPIHLEAAVAAGKHVFMEKPVAVDAPGVRRVLAASEEAKQNNLALAVGLQRRHEKRYLETVQRIHDGALGDILVTRVYWNGGGVWVRGRKPQQTEMEYQMRNWYYFNWLCGDHIVEQHIHNLDVGNWLLNDHPQSAQGQGGREVRKDREHGEIFDHHIVEFTYENGAKMFSQCRHIRNCWNNVSEYVHGTKGSAKISGGPIRDGDGKDLWSYGSGGGNGHQEEHHDLFAALRRGELPNEGEYGATSTMTAIFGRMATYSGQSINWDDAINSDIDLSPAAYSFDADPPVLPDSDGYYPVAVPGITKVV